MHIRFSTESLNKPNDKNKIHGTPCLPQPHQKTISAAHHP